MVQILLCGSGVLRVVQTLYFIIFFFLFLPSNQSKTCVIKYSTFQHTRDHQCADEAAGEAHVRVGEAPATSVSIGIPCKCGVG